MDRDQFRQLLHDQVGPELAEFMLALFGDTEDFEAIGFEPEKPADRIQREAWEMMYPATYSAEPMEGGCPHCGSSKCPGAQRIFPSHVH